MSPSDIQRLINGSSSWEFGDREKEDNTVARYRVSDREVSLWPPSMNGSAR